MRVSLSQLWRISCKLAEWFWAKYKSFSGLECAINEFALNESSEILLILRSQTETLIHDFIRVRLKILDWEQSSSGRESRASLFTRNMKKKTELQVKFVSTGDLMRLFFHHHWTRNEIVVNHRLFAPFLFESNAEWRLSRKQIDSITLRELKIIGFVNWCKATEGDENKSIFVNNEVFSASTSFDTIFNFFPIYFLLPSRRLRLSLSLSPLKAIMNALSWFIMKFELLKALKCTAPSVGERLILLSLCHFKFLSKFMFDSTCDLFL